MSEQETRRLLVVANRTKSTPRLLEAIEGQARAGCEISLMVPPERHPDDPDWTPQVAQELVQRAAGGQTVTLIDTGDDAAATIGALVESGEVDEILLCTPPEHHERWHQHTLPKRIQAMGVPVTAIAPHDKGWIGNHGFPDDWVRPEIGPLT